MKKILVFASAAVFVASVSAFAQPKLEVQGNDTFNWGKVSPKDMPLKTKLTVKNAGTEELDIKEVKPGCGCTTPTLAKNKLKPGESTVLEIGLNLPSSTGEITKSLTITSNDPTQATKIYFLKANIVRALRAQPDYLVFNDLEAGKESVTTFKLINNSNQEVTFSDFTTSGGVSLSVGKSVTIKAGGEIEIKARVRPKEKGYLNATVSMKTTLADYPTFDINSYGAVKEAQQSPALNR